MKKKVLAAILAVLLLALIPLFVLRDADFGGTDDAASAVVEEVDGAYEPWAAPLLDGLSGETETLFFCVQTGIGVGVIAYYMGRLVERKKHEAKKAEV